MQKHDYSIEQKYIIHNRMQTYIRIHIEYFIDHL